MMASALALSVLARGDDGVAFLFLIPVAAIAIVMWLWGKSRSRSMLEQWAAMNGVRLLDAEARGLFRGPFFWTTSKSQTVYRITVQYPDGAVRQGYARCGGWLLGLLSDNVEVRWDELDYRQSAPGGFPIVMPGHRPADGRRDRGGSS